MAEAQPKAVEGSRVRRDGLTLGELAPAFSLQDIDSDETISLDAFHGKHVLVVFTDPGCGPCDALLPNLVELAVPATQAGLETVIVGRGDLEENQAKRKRLGVDLPYVVQSGWSLSKAYALFATPVGFLVSPEREIAAAPAIGGPAIVELVTAFTAATTRRRRQHWSSFSAPLTRLQAVVLFAKGLGAVLGLSACGGGGDSGGRKTLQSPLCGGRPFDPQTQCCVKADGVIQTIPRFPITDLNYCPDRVLHGPVGSRSDVLVFKEPRPAVFPTDPAVPPYVKYTRPLRDELNACYNRCDSSWFGCDGRFKQSFEDPETVCEDAYARVGRVASGRELRDCFRHIDSLLARVNAPGNAGNAALFDAAQKRHCDCCGSGCGKEKSRCSDGLCVAGQCSCPPGETRCGETCTNLVIDPSHCGACGNACLGGRICQGGTCVCPDGHTLCNGVCANFKCDPNHCGRCENRCPAGQTCVNGACTSCEKRYVFPDGAVACCGKDELPWRGKPNALGMLPNPTCCNSKVSRACAGIPEMNCKCCGSGACTDYPEAVETAACT